METIKKNQIIGRLMDRWSDADDGATTISRELLADAIEALRHSVGQAALAKQADAVPVDAVREALQMLYDDRDVIEVITAKQAAQVATALAQRVVSEAVPVVDAKLAVGVHANRNGVTVAVHLKHGDVTTVLYTQDHPLNRETAGIANVPAGLFTTPPAAPVALSDADIALILDGLKVADALIDMIPTRLHEHADSAIARIGELINLKGGYNAVASANRCFNKFATATKPSKNMALSDATDNEQAEAWMAVVSALDKYMPDWLSGPHSGLDSAVMAIEKMFTERGHVSDLKILQAANEHLNTADYIWTADAEQLYAFAGVILAATTQPTDEDKRDAGKIAVPCDRLQNWIDVIHDNERSMGDRLQSLSSTFALLLKGVTPSLQPIREQHHEAGWNMVCGDWKDDLVAIHGQQGHIASGLTVEQARAIIDAHGGSKDAIAASAKENE